MPPLPIVFEKTCPTPHERSITSEADLRPRIVQNVEFTEPHVFHGCGSTQKTSGYASNHDNDMDVLRYFDQRNKDENSSSLELTFQTDRALKNDVVKDTKEEGSVKHLIAGGVAGCVASIVTCPLDVIKTRQQSSGHAQTLSIQKPHLTTVSPLRPQMAQSARLFTRAGKVQMTHLMPVEFSYLNKYVAKGTKISGGSILQHYRYIMKVEGARSLYKGLGPTLVGVVPSRAIYFFAYSNAKRFYTKHFGLNQNSSSLHLLSAASAGACCTTATSPLWVIKTKLQLHRSVRNRMTVRECCAMIWRSGGVRGFYRGITASYAGTLETIIHFVIYERLKLLHMKDKAVLCAENEKSYADYLVLMAIAAMSKSTATCVAYPHEVVRTRLREETKQAKYRGFFQTLSLVARQEGMKALYRGLGTQIVRQVPNMAIVMGTYEFLIDSSRRK